MKVNKNKNIVIDELEDMIIEEVKKPEVKKPNVINIMDEDNDNDQTPNNNKKIKDHFDQNLILKLHVMIFQLLNN